MFLREKKLWFILHFRTLETFIVGGSPMLKTVKNGSGIRIGPPLFFLKFPHFPVFFLKMSLNKIATIFILFSNSVLSLRFQWSGRFRQITPSSLRKSLVRFHPFPFIFLQVLSKGVAAVLGPRSRRNSEHIKSMCDNSEIPFIETRGPGRPGYTWDRA